MSFIEHTLTWCRGEILEGKVVLTYALALIVISFLIWKFSSISSHKVLLIPLLISAVVYLGVGSTLLVSNPKRVEQYQVDYKKDPVAFVQSEKERTDKFISWYPKTAWSLIIIAILALLAYALADKSYIHALSLGIVLFCLSGLGVDYFSKERAAIYSEHIKQELASLNISAK